jgi:hypothetical protein
MEVFANLKPGQRLIRRRKSTIVEKAIP